MEDVEIIRGDEIEPKEVEWLWYPYIPYGKVTLVQGDPGDGKSTFVLTLAALLTTSNPLPFSIGPRAPINVIYQNTEDDADDTVIPRFLKAGGNPERLCFINEKKKAVTFSDSRIIKAIEQVNAKVLVLDPLSSYIGSDVSINSANEVRAQFNPLINYAKESGCAIIIIGHLNKMPGTKAIYRTTGSIDIVGAARSSLLIARTENDNPSERVMAVQKSNLAPTGKAILFSVSNNGVEWLEETEMTADEILGNTYNSVGRPDDRFNAAKDFIRELLSDGPKSAVECNMKLQASGIHTTTAKKAKKELGVLSKKQGSTWFWLLPSSD